MAIEIIQPACPIVYSVYAVISPDTQDPIYIGFTRQALKQRLIGHISDANSTKTWKHKSKFHVWLKEQLDAGRYPEIRLLVAFSDYESASDAEITVIRSLLARKHTLLNGRMDSYLSDRNWIKTFNTAIATKAA